LGGFCSLLRSKGDVEHPIDAEFKHTLVRKREVLYSTREEEKCQSQGDNSIRRRGAPRLFSIAKVSCCLPLALAESGEIVFVEGGLSGRDRAGRDEVAGIAEFARSKRRNVGERSCKFKIKSKYKLYEFIALQMKGKTYRVSFAGRSTFSLF
jgi:hypothetical protein